MRGEAIAIVLAGLTSVACAGAPAARNEETPDPCNQIATDEARLGAEPWVEKLDAMLAHRLFQARHGVAYERCAHVAPRVDLGLRISVDVEHTGDLEALRGAGLDTGLDRDGTVSGIVALRDVEALARLDAVVRIVAEPIAEPDAQPIAEPDAEQP